MNIHFNPAILGFTRYQGFDPSPNDENVKCFNVAVLNALEKLKQILWQQQHWIVQ